MKKTVFLCVVDFFYNPALPYREGVCYNVLGKKQKNTLLTLKALRGICFFRGQGQITENREELLMGGFFGVAAKKDCVFDLFFGIDYHSHLGTRRAGMAVYDLSLIHI